VVAGPVTADGIASAEAFGSPQLDLNVSATGVAGGEAFGSPVVSSDLSVSPTGIASAEAFGSPQLDLNVVADGVASGEALGSPQLGLNVVATGIPSGEAIGAPEVDLALFGIGGIPSAEAFGSPVVAGPVTADGVPSAEAFGSPQLDLTIYPTGLAGGEAFGAPQVAISVGPVGIPGGEAFGAPQLDLNVVADGVASAEVIGAPQVDLTVYPTGVVSGEALGVPVVAFSVGVDGIPSAEAFGSPIVAGPVTANGVASAEAIGTPVIEAFGVFRSFGPAVGDIIGGTSVLLAGAILDMGPCRDDFEDGVVGPLWSVVTAGSGQVVETSGQLRFDSQTTAGSSAGVQSVAKVGDVDIEITAEPTAAQPLSSSITVADFALDAGASDQARLQIITTNSGNEVRLALTRSGVTETLVLSTNTAAFPSATVFRFIRKGARLIVYLNGEQVLDAPWSTLPAYIEMGVQNGTTNTRAAMSVETYERRALVSFGDEPVRTYLSRTEGHLIAVTPEAEQTGTVDITVVGCTSQETIANGFTYTAENRYTMAETATSSLVVLDDPVLREE
jgi:hypothetical protein